MLWEQIETNRDKKALALALIERVPVSGWREHTLSAASEAAFRDANQWRRLFPRGARDAIWYISEVSDASMKLPFLASPAPSMCAVICKRLDQNSHLKPFVRKVMIFDVIHPVLAFFRMQRTSRAMFECLARAAPEPTRRAVATLNLTYTAIVFVWLFDRTHSNALTKWIIKRSMRIVARS